MLSHAELQQEYHVGYQGGRIRFYRSFIDGHETKGGYHWPIHGYGLQKFSQLNIYLRMQVE
jgi:hypothetical protein